MMDEFHDLPDWDDKGLPKEQDEEGEAWKPDPTREACKALYDQWQQVVSMLNGALAGVADAPEEKKEDNFPKDFWEETIQNLLSDALVAAAKIRSSEANGVYVLRMENAAIIRKCANDIRTHLLAFELAPGMDENYIIIIRQEIDMFRELFKAWVDTFERDEYEDEWGLFL